MANRATATPPRPFGRALTIGVHMDLTGSIAEITQPLSAELLGSAGAGVGSAFVDTLVQTAFLLPNLLLAFVGGLGGDLGSTGSVGGPVLPI